MDVRRSNSLMDKFGVVVIGRNEGDRLERCLKSLSAATVVVYVDSGSSDGSAQLARDLGVDVVELDKNLPFTAARARNIGFRRLRLIVPDIVYLQFVDGDCELIEGWPEQALSFLDSHEDVGAVCGWRRERFPESSIYIWLCDYEWSSDGRVGPISLCGGDVMLRTDTFESVNGYRDDLICGEDPEICIRMRAAGWRIWRLDTTMTLHDAAITRFGQWWRRAVRGGYAFAQGAYLHGAPPERHWVWESRRAWLVGVFLPLLCLVLGLAFPPWGWATWLVYPLYVLEKFLGHDGTYKNRAFLAFFNVLVQFPYGWGQIKFMCDRLLSRQAELIEYRGRP
jgi:GT2 family glycosyltransferase